jgi:DHA1 family multidrug resistance protein-like MFS transporter
MRGKAFGLVTSAQQFGGVVGPLLGAFLGGFMSTRLVLCSMGGVLLITALYTYKCRLHRNFTEEKVF